MTAPGGRVLASTHGTQVYHPAPQDYWRWTHTGLARLFEEQADWESVEVSPGAGTATTLAMLLGTYVEIALRRTPLAKPPVWLLDRFGAALDARVRSLREPVPGSLTANFHVVATVASGLFRRNALGIYAVYAAAMVSGLVVTPILLRSIGTEAFGIWAFIGGITIYLAVLDIGLGPSVVRFTAEAHGRATRRRSTAVASVALVLYAGIGVLTLVAGAIVSWFVPVLIDAPADLVWDARVSDVSRHAFARGPLFPLGLFYNLLGGRAALRRAEPRQLRRDRPLRGSRRAPDPTRRRAGAARGVDDPRHGHPSGAAAGVAATRVARAQPAARLHHA